VVWEKPSEADKVLQILLIYFAVIFLSAHVPQAMRRNERITPAREALEAIPRQIKETTGE
jgi:hypothetical protein